MISLRSKEFVSIALLSAIGTAALAIKPQPAHAMVEGAYLLDATVNPLAYPALVGGLVLFLGGIPTATYLLGSHYRTAMLGAPLFCLSFIGGILLTDDSSQTMSLGNLGRMTDETARRYGISPETMSVLRDNQPELDALSEETLAEFAHANKPIVAAARDAWRKYLSSLDQDTQDALRDALTQIARAETR